MPPLLRSRSYLKLCVFPPGLIQPSLFSSLLFTSSSIALDKLVSEFLAIRHYLKGVADRDGLPPWRPWSLEGIISKKATVQPDVAVQFTVFLSDKVSASFRCSPTLLLFFATTSITTFYNVAKSFLSFCLVQVCVCFKLGSKLAVDNSQTNDIQYAGSLYRVFVYVGSTKVPYLNSVERSRKGLTYPCVSNIKSTLAFDIDSMGCTTSRHNPYM